MTLYTSNDRKAMFGYFGLTAFCGLFSFVYELFSHQVYSIYMIGMGCIPLLLGALPILLLLLHGRHRDHLLGRRLQLWSIMTLTCGSCLTGVMEIYGSISQYTKYYWIAGGLLLAGAAAIQIREQRKMPLRENRRISDVRSENIQAI